MLVEEGKVAIFLLATTGIANVRHSIMKNKMAFEVSMVQWSEFLCFHNINVVYKFVICSGKAE